MGGACIQGDTLRNHKHGPARKQVAPCMHVKCGVRATQCHACVYHAEVGAHWLAALVMPLSPHTFIVFCCGAMTARVLRSLFQRTRPPSLAKLPLRGLCPAEGSPPRDYCARLSAVRDPSGGMRNEVPSMGNVAAHAFARTLMHEWAHTSRDPVYIWESLCSLHRQTKHERVQG